MATARHNKHCTFKKTHVCICANLDAALAEQAKKHEDALFELRRIRHRSAVEDYRAGIIRAFTNLIDEKFTVESTSTCTCCDNSYRY